MPEIGRYGGQNEQSRQSGMGNEQKAQENAPDSLFSVLLQFLWYTSKGSLKKCLLRVLGKPSEAVLARQLGRAGIRNPFSFNIMRDSASQGHYAFGVPP